MRATIYPGKLQGTIRVPSSPALTQRAILGACLCDSHTLIQAECADAQTLALEGVLAEAGFPVAHDGTHYLCRGHGAFRQNAVIDCQKNIAALDFLLPLVPQGTTFQNLPPLTAGAFSLRSRILSPHGRSFSLKDGTLAVSGALKSGVYPFASPVCIRLACALLFALAQLDGVSMLNIGARAAQMRPYLEMTGQMLSRFGVRVMPSASGYVVCGNQKFVSPGKITVEGDWSCGAFVAAAQNMGDAISAENLRLDSQQPEKRIHALLPRLGGIVPIGENLALLPALCAAAAVKSGTTIFRGFPAQNDPRAKAIGQVLNALGVRTDLYDDAMTVRGGTLYGGECVDSHGDSRIAMSVFFLAPHAMHPTELQHAEAVLKADPSFFERFRALGGVMILD